MKSIKKLPIQILALSILVVVQAVCAGVFLSDILKDVASHDEVFLSSAEIAATVSLAIGIVVEIYLLRTLYLRQLRMEQGLAVARGALSNVMADYFEGWKLSPAEQDVATFTIKGYSISEVANLRCSAEATIKAQLNAIYRKANVQNRTQLMSVLVDDLMREPLVKH